MHGQWFDTVSTHRMKTRLSTFIMLIVYHSQKQNQFSKLLRGSTQISGVTEGEEGGSDGKCPPGSSDVGPFIETDPPLILLSLLPNSLMNLKPLVYLNKFVFATAFVSCKALRKCIILSGTCIAKIVGLV